MSDEPFMFPPNSLGEAFSASGINGGGGGGGGSNVYTL